MSIKQIDLFHGAVISKITRNPSNKISLIEWEEKENRALYKVETEHSSDMSIFIKYDTTPRESKNKVLIWDFYDLLYRENCRFCFVCIEAKVIDGDTIMEICAIPEKELPKLFTPEEREHQQKISCRVKLEKGKSFRVSRKRKNIELTINRNKIGKI